MPENIYKSHLKTSHRAGLINVNSAEHNLASIFVNAFINTEFDNDKMMLIEDDS